MFYSFLASFPTLSFVYFPFHLLLELTPILYFCSFKFHHILETHTHTHTHTHSLSLSLSLSLLCLQSFSRAQDHSVSVQILVFLLSINKLISLWKSDKDFSLWIKYAKGTCAQIDWKRKAIQHIFKLGNEDIYRKYIFLLMKIIYILLKT